MKKSFKTVAALTALLAASSPVQSSSVNHNQVVRESSKNAIPVQSAMKYNFSIRNMFGGFSGQSNPRKHKFGVLNQRQYRKLVRQNPCLLKSKKHRSKN